MFIFRILASKSITKLHRNTEFKNMYTYPDKAGKYFWLYGSWESWNIQIIKKHFFTVPSDGVFLDIGANLGCYTVNLADTFNRVISFEPAPIAWKILAANIQSNELSNCQLIKKGVGSENKYTNLNIIPNNSGLSSIDNNIVGGIATPIEIVRLDDTIDPKDNIRLIKIDVEGYE